MNQDERLLDFNFWPSFADAMLAFVIIVIILLVFVLFSGVMMDESIRIAQSDVTAQINANYEGELVDRYDRGTESHYVIKRNGVEEIEIYSSLQLQRITFRGSVLFPVNRYELSPEGQEALRTVGRAFMDQLDAIEQIQIEGHTDSMPTGTYEEGNLELGARRAISVLRFLEEDEELGIDPASQLMSATSYGEFRPVSREVGQVYDMGALEAANRDDSLRQMNRRIELLLIYRGSE